MSTREFWDDHYRNTPDTWGAQPNAALVDTLTELGVRASGDGTSRALDLGAGHGGDACWLAGLGWSVTAVDVSPTALRRVAGLARQLGVSGRVRTRVHDLTNSTPPGSFDLITATYLQLSMEHPEVLRRAWSQLSDDGVLVVIDHASRPPWSWAPEDSTFPSAQETLTHLALEAGTAPTRQLSVQRCTTRERRAQGPDGSWATVSDNVLVVRSGVG